jgi:hypothetical protein
MTKSNVAAGDLLSLSNAGTGKAIYVSHTGTSDAIEIISAGLTTSLNITKNSVTNPGSTSEIVVYAPNLNTADYWCGEFINATNAGAGTVSGLSFNLTSAGKTTAFNFNGSEVENAAVGGTQTYKIHILIGGVDFYIPCWTA